jgi:hypothetical protein
MLICPQISDWYKQRCSKVIAPNNFENMTFTNFTKSPLHQNSKTQTAFSPTQLKTSPQIMKVMHNTAAGNEAIVLSLT